MSRIKQSIFQREPLARTWAKKSFRDEMESVAPSSPTRSNFGQGEVDLESQTQQRGGLMYVSFLISNLNESES